MKNETQICRFLGRKETECRAVNGEKFSILSQGISDAIRQPVAPFSVKDQQVLGSLFATQVQCQREPLNRYVSLPTLALDSLGVFPADAVPLECNGLQMREE